ncbi:MAG: amidohydrolase [Alphaproteobacteria bacterium]|nr:amidohydrolase [Alphaproteobacteria bacterium]
MKIVDAQVHIWAADTPARPWPGRGAPAHREPLGKDELLGAMDQAGVARAILVPPSWEGDRNDLSIAAARAHPDRFAVMGRFNPDQPDAREVLAGWRRQPGMLGMRFTFHTPILRQPLLDGAFDWVWSACEREGIPIMALFHHEYLRLLDGIAERHLGLRLVLDHLGLKSGHDVDEALNFATLDQVLVLARRPNIAVKTSALPCYTRDRYPFRALHEPLRRVVDAFGPARSFWGSDYSRLPCSYRESIDFFGAALPGLSDADRASIMGRGISGWLGWTD